MQSKKLVLTKNNSMDGEFNREQRNTGFRVFLQSMLSPYQKYILSPLMKDFVSSRIKQLESKIIIQQAILDGLDFAREEAVDLFVYRKISETESCIKQLSLLKQQAESDLRNFNISS
ncbi:MAG: hypothetical protein HRU09_11170 [Oligoflexales bacterium]|nr:hypothetical protein [Oligoflexales bacterium]